jgi:hypothetical protein
MRFIHTLVVTGKTKLVPLITLTAVTVVFEDERSMTIEPKFGVDGRCYEVIEKKDLC